MVDRPSILDRLKSGLRQSTTTKGIKEQWFDIKADTVLQWQFHGTKDKKAPGSPSFRSSSLMELSSSLQSDVAVGGPRGLLRTSRPESRRQGLGSTSTTTVGEDASVTDWPTDSSVITQSRASSSAAGSREIYGSTELQGNSVEMRSVEEVLKGPSKAVVGSASRQEEDASDEFIGERWLPITSRQRRKSVDPTWAASRIDEVGPTVRLDLRYQMLSSNDGLALVKGKGSIQELDISCNNIKSFILPDGNDWRKLVAMDLSSCMLMDLNVSNCWPPQLKRLSVADNRLRRLSGTLPKTLEVLECQRNCLESLEGVEALTRLGRLDASHNGIGSQAIEEALKPLRNLVVMDLGYNKIDKIGSGTFLGLRALKELRLDANSIRNLSFIPKGNSLSIISVACNRLKSLKGLPRCPQLIELYLSSNRLHTMEGISEVCPSLEVLELADNRLEEGRPVAKELSSLKDLAELTLPAAAEDTDRPTTAESMVVEDKLKPMMSGFWDEDKLQEEWTNTMYRAMDDLDLAMKRFTSSANEDLQKMSRWLAEAEAVIEKGAYMDVGDDQWEGFTVDESEV